MSFLQRRAWRRLEHEARRAAGGALNITELVKARAGANGVRPPFADPDDVATAHQCLALAEGWLRASPAQRRAIEPQLAALAACLGEALDDSTPKPAFRRDIDD